MNKLFIITSLLLLIGAAITAPKFDYVIHEGDEDNQSSKKSLVRLDSNSQFFKTEFFHKSLSHQITHKGKKKTIVTESSLIFSRFLRRREAPIECQHLWDKHYTYGYRHVFEVNMIRYSSHYQRCYYLSFYNAAKKITETKQDDGRRSLRIEWTHVEDGVLYTENFYFNEGTGEGLKSIRFTEQINGLLTSNVHDYHYELDLKATDFEIFKQEDSFYSLKIRDPSKHHTLLLDKNNYNVKNPLIRYSKNGVTLSMNFNSMLDASEMPNKAGCRDMVHETANYMLEHGNYCTFGVFSRMPYVSYHEKDAFIPYSVANLQGNSEPHEIFEIQLLGREFLPHDDDILTKETKDIKGKLMTVHKLKLRFERSEYKVIIKEPFERFVKFLFGIICILMPAFFLITFNSDFQTNGIYLLQFGVLFIMFSNLTLSIVEHQDQESKWYWMYPILVFNTIISFLCSDSKIEGLIVVWQSWTFIDYFLMSFLMVENGTFWLAVVNIGVFFFLTMILNCFKDNVRYFEWSISLTTSLSLLTLLGDLLYHTTTLSRILMFFERHKIHDRDPKLYYLGFGIIFSMMSFARLFMADYMSWNVQARIRVPSEDPMSNEISYNDKEVELTETAEHDLDDDLDDTIDSIEDEIEKKQKNWD